MAKAYYTFIPKTTPPPPDPEAPRNVSVAGGDAALLVTFDHPFSGQPSTGYQARVKNMVTGVETIIGFSTNVTQPASFAATNGQLHSLELRSVNSGLYSDWTSPVYATPEAPTTTYQGVSNWSATFGNAQILTSWTLPNQAGRTSLELVITRPSGDETIPLGVNATSYTITNNISNGTSYSVKIRVKYDSNYSNFSATLTGTPTAPVVGSTVTKTFSAHTLDEPNPERGVTFIHMVYSSFGTNQPRPLPTVPTSTRLVQFRYVLHDFLTSNVSSSFLNHLTADLARAREQGVKVIYWPSYWSNGPVYPGMTEQYGGTAALQARDLGKSDTTHTWIKAHWNQIAPILNANKDVIAWVQIGSMGAWGEGNKSAWGLDYDNNSPAAIVKEVIDHALSLLDTSIKVSLRYIPALRVMYGSSPVSAAAAHGTSTKARIGGWDDYAGSLYGSSDRTFLAEHNLYFPYHGEGVPGSYSYSTIGGVNGLNFFRDQRWTAFQPFGGDFRTTWENEGVYDDILRGLGYRYVLLESRIPATAARNTTLNVILRIRNDGFANATNARRAEIVLRNKSTNVYTRLTGLADIRLGANRFPDPATRSGSSYVATPKDVTLSATVPSTLATGNYQVLVNLPDPNFLNPATANHRKYSMRLMSRDAQGVDIWDSTRAYNAVGDVVIT